MNNELKVTVEPECFDASHLLDNPDEASIDRIGPDFYLGAGSPLYPKFRVEEAFGFEDARAWVNVNMPHKVTIEVDSAKLKDFAWRKILIPVIIAIDFTKESIPGRGLFMSFVDKSGRCPLKTVPVASNVWANRVCFGFDCGPPAVAGDDIYNRPMTMGGLNAFGHTDFWNMTYFTDLPKCSMSYDFWVTARGIDSERKPFDIEFYVDGQKVTQDNFEKMAEKYPALKDEPGQ